MHYWSALVLLGIGWNFLFLSGTSILPQSYLHHERHKVQATNDFPVFAIQAIASLSAAWVLFAFGWRVQVLICIPLTLILVMTAVIYLLKKSDISGPATVTTMALANNSSVFQTRCKYVLYALRQLPC